MIIGSVRSIDTIPLGTTLVQDVALGGTTLIVSDVFDFDEDGGLLMLDLGRDDNPILNYIEITATSNE